MKDLPQDIPDRIQKHVVLAASRARIWDAISVADQFGAWFGMKFDGPFVAGKVVTGVITPTTVDPEVAKLQAPHSGKPFELRVEAIEPMRRFAFRWHPFAVGPKEAYAAEPTTLVSFELSDGEGGVQLTITESGFDGIPQPRRTAAFAANDGGWAHQCRLLEKFLRRGS